MDEWKAVLKTRLAETFGDETQELIARKLNMTQGNVSKWVTGPQIPTVDTLFEIAKAYRVSVDWLLGLSNQKEIDGVVVEKLTYGQVALIIDKLLENNTAEVPDLVEVAETSGINLKQVDESEDEQSESIEPVIDSDYIKIKDRVLSYLLRRRLKLAEIDPEMHDTWKEKLISFQELRLLSYSILIQEAIDANNPARFKDGDWVELVERLSDMTDEEITEYVEDMKEKEGKNDGRKEHS